MIGKHIIEIFMAINKATIIPELENIIIEKGNSIEGNENIIQIISKWIIERIYKNDARKEYYEEIIILHESIKSEDENIIRKIENNKNKIKEYTMGNYSLGEIYKLQISNMITYIYNICIDEMDMKNKEELYEIVKKYNKRINKIIEEKTIKEKEKIKKGFRKLFETIENEIEYYIILESWIYIIDDIKLKKYLISLKDD